MLVLVIFALLVIAVLVVGMQVRLPALRLGGVSPREQKLQALQQWLQKVHDAGKFNGVVLLCWRGNTVFSGSYGDDAADSPNPLSLQSAFNLASVSKQFTAFCILLLEHRGQLSIDDTLECHLPELAGYRSVTVRHLLQHTAGLPDYMQLARKAGFSNPVFTIADMIQLLVRQMPASGFRAGDKFRYSNTGYVLLAEIVSRVSGRSFTEFCATELFRPLGMHNSCVFNHLSVQAPANRVFGFRKSLFTKKCRSADLHQFDGVAGDGAVYSSAEDLKIWHDSLHRGALLPVTVYQSALQRGTLNSGRQIDYGYGWFIGRDDSVEHAGGWQGFSSYLYRTMSDNSLLVILDNSGNVVRVGAMGFRFHSIGLVLKKFLADY
ncbi:MAG: serine hydrolase domain-containing protein [Pseudomonadota bacterium]